MWDKDNNYFAILSIVAIVSVYIIPDLSLLIFIVFLALAYVTKKDYLWVAFVILLMDAPGNLFSAGTRDEAMRLPLFSLGPGFSFSTIEMFLFVFLIKHFPFREFKNHIFYRDFWILFIFIIMLFIYSYVIGMSMSTIIITVRSLLNWGWLIIFVCVLRKSDDVKKLVQLLFPVVLIALATQLYAFITGHHIDDMLRGIDSRRTILALDEEVDRASRVISSPYILLISFVMSLYFIFDNTKRYFPTQYLYVIAASCYLSIFLSATRGWIIAMTFLTVLVFISQLNRENLMRMIGMTITCIIVLSVTYYALPVVKIQINNVIDRMQTVERIADGDLTAGGSDARLAQRAPRVMEKYKEKPIFGWGFSDIYYNHRDSHVGHHNLLLSVGLIGYILVFGYYIKWNIVIYKFSNYLDAINPGTGKQYIIFSLGFVAILLIHSTSTQIIGVHLGILPQKYILSALLLSIFSTFYNHELSED